MQKLGPSCLLLLLSHLRLLLVDAALPTSVRFGAVFTIFDPATGLPDPSGMQELAAFEMAISDINSGVFPSLLKDPATGNRILIKRAVRTLNGQFIDALNAALDINKWQSDGMIGASTNTISNAIAQINNGYKQNQVAYGSTGSYLSYATPYPYYFRVCSDDAYQGYALAEVLKFGFPQWSTVSVFSTTGNDLGYGSDLYQQFQLHATEIGLTVASSHQFRAGLLDLSVYINAAKAVGTRVFVLFMQGGDAANLLYQGWQQGLFTPGTQIIGSNQIIGQETLSKFPPDAFSRIAEIMKGVIAMRQTVLTSNPSPTYKEWVARWRKQATTVPLNGLGQPDYEDTANCIPTKDDSAFAPAAPSGNTHFLYKGTTIHSATDKTPATRCAGIDFSAFKEDGSDIAALAPFAYDATIALATGIHKTLFVGVPSGDGSQRAVQTGAYGDADYFGGDNLCLVMGEDINPSVGTLNAVPFIVTDTITGRVHFRQGDSTGYGFGDREVDISFDVLNFNPGTYCFKDRSGGVEVIGKWKAAYPKDPSGNLAPNYVPSSTTTIVYNTLDNSSPFDRTPPVINSLQASASAVLVVLAVLCVAVAIGFTAMIARYRHLKLVRAYQPVMLYLTLFGFLLATVRILLAANAFTDQVCIGDIWFGHLAFWTSFSTLSIKTWRVHLIINSSMKRIKISTTMVVMATFGIVLLVCFYLALMTGLGKPHKSYQIVELGQLQQIWYPACVDRNPNWATALYVIEAVWLAQGARLCWLTKDAPDAVNDSGPIATAMYVIIFVAVVVFLLVFLIKLEPQTSELIIGLGFALATLSAEMALFLPKAILLWKGCDLNNKMQIVLPNGKLLQDNSAESSSSGGHPGSVAPDGKPTYAADVKLGKDKYSNMAVCKEQINKWTKLMQDIEARQLIASTGSGSGSKSSIGGSQGNFSQSQVDDETSEDGGLLSTSNSNSRYSVTQAIPEEEGV